MKAATASQPEPVLSLFDLFYQNGILIWFE